MTDNVNALQTDEKEFIKTFIENLKADLMKRMFSLEFTLMDTSDEVRLGASHYPFSHLELVIPHKHTPELVKTVKNMYEIDFLQLSFFANTPTDLHNAYCSLIGESCLVNHFLKRDIGSVYIWDPDDRRDLEKLGLNLNPTKYCSRIGEIENHAFRPYIYHTVPAKDFNKWLSETEDIKMLDMESNLPEDKIRKELEEYNKNPLKYKEIFEFREV